MWVFRRGGLTDFWFIHKKKIHFPPPKKGYKTVPEEASPVEATGASATTGSAPSATDTSQRFAGLAGDSATDTGGERTWWKGGGGFRFSSRPYEGKPPFSRSFTPYYISSPLFFFQNHPCKWYPYISLYIPEFLRLKRSLFRLTSWIFKNRGLVSWVRLVF